MTQKEYDRAYYLKNRLKRIRQTREWYLQNREGMLEYRRGPNRSKERENFEKWKKENPERWAEFGRKRNRKRMKNPYYRLVSRLRRRILLALKRNHKSGRTLELLGCSSEHVRLHLESKFKPGMTWENHGSVWHIDHIKPCAKFDLSTPEQQKLCFNWVNLQPLFALENLQKGAR